MEKNNGGNAERRYDSYNHPREDKYQYYYFSSGDFPWGESLVAQIQAQSYVNMQIVRPEAVTWTQDVSGEYIQVLSPSASHPAGIVDNDLAQMSRVEYALGIEKGSSDYSLETGRLVAWKKVYAPLETLPVYQFCKDDLNEAAKEYLKDAAENQHLVLVEPEALGKTVSAEAGTIKEFIRSEVQRAYGKGELWFMGLVEKTVYESWVYSWGPSAVNRIGKSKKLAHPYGYDEVTLVPAILDVDNFYANMAEDILTADRETAKRLTKNFVYMTNGMSGSQLGDGLSQFRHWAQRNDVG